ncbi:HAD family hydrolase [Paenibacillus segetis]|uniref:Hydrolase of the HAD superfamily n=1 Tax=Paenibacillus segetis TaxID=1325360 RepID=A0ABQ1Y9A3_9BACL|nr:HAD family hydrolase [Paenibacillus segetis]GGH16358.1 hypothetical protein GCM10008013_11100 [Paenibacillus segetis]
MSRFEVISLDMFQTLVNVDSRKEQVWKRILQDTYTSELASEYGRTLLEHYYSVATEARRLREFVLTSDIYRGSFERIFAQHHISYDSSVAVEILFQEHRLSKLYEETEDVLKRLIKEFQVCIVSDTDIMMLPEFYKNYSIPLFASEQYQSYKNDQDNRMFKEVIQHYDIEPSKIIHIGDTTSDVIGAKRAGMTTCWINRDQQQWNQDIQPDYIIESLDEIFDIVNNSSIKGRYPC